MKKYLLFLLFVFSINIAYPHSDFGYDYDSGKVKVSIVTGFDYEELRKAQILSVLADSLSSEMKNNHKIQILLNHKYTSPDCEPEYNVYSTKSGFGKSVLVVKVADYSFDIPNILHLVEHAILNKQTMSKWPYGLSADRVLLYNPMSDLLKRILNIKVYRPYEGYSLSPISYYFQNNKYHVFIKDFRTEETVLKVFDNIFKFEEMKSNDIIVFDTNKSFFFFDSDSYISQPRNKVSERHVFDNKGSFRPCKVTYMGGDRFSICIYYHPVSEELFRKYYDEPLKYEYHSINTKNMVYIATNEVLIENLDELIDDAAMQQLGLK
jgi:hypothetical protein